MSKSRIIAASTALAIGASVLVAPQSFAATIGPKDEQGYCKITYTDAEKKAAIETAKSYRDATANSVLNAYESQFKGSKKVLTDFQNEAAIQQYVKEAAASKTYEASEAKTEKFNEVVDAYIKKLTPLGLSEDAAEIILLQTASYLESTRVEIKLESDLKVKGEAEPKAAEPMDYSTLFNFEALTEAQQAKLTESVKSDAALKKFEEAFAKEDKASMEARKACAAGGNKEVKFGTQVVDQNGSSVGGSSAGGTGELSPGAIAGIVIAALVVLGIGAVVAAPMLGIALPFELPALPALPF